MPTEGSFRQSLYLTLALACAAIGYAEASFLFEAPIVASIVIAALAVLYRFETRLELLSIPAANRLGLLLGMANVAWAIFRVLRELNDPQMPNTDWSVLGLGLTGPLAMTLMPAKLARREKHAGDYWWLHGLALAAAALAAAMAEDLLGFILIGAYAGCAIWNIVTFGLLRSSGRIRPIPGEGPRLRVAGLVGDSRFSGALRIAAALSITALVLTVPLYLITPRSIFPKLAFGKPRVEIGFAADQMVDLTQTGTLRSNDRIAFEVIAENDSGQPVELSPEQRWRGVVKGRYQSGRWPDSTDFKLPTVGPHTLLETLGSLPMLWSDQVQLRFAVPFGAPTRFLCDPVRWEGGQPAPVLSAIQGGYRPWVWGGNGGFISDGRRYDPNETVRYVQLWRAGDDDDLSSPFRIIDINLNSVLHPLKQNPVPMVKEYADELIEQMVRDRRLPADHRDRLTMLPRREFHDAIARAFSTHLATTPSLTYTTDLRRVRKDLDPIEDFLFHTRAGHCERFASALVLLLRSQGIPAVLVLGFKGCEATSEPGRYVVRQSHAHAWVEALIEDFQPRPWWDVWHPSRWRSLDPTPAGSPTDEEGDGWMDRSASQIRRLYNTYIIDYSPEQRRGAIAGALKAMSQWEVLAATGAVLSIGLAGRAILRQRRRRSAPSSEQSRWFDQLIAVLLPYGYKPRAGETAREFATRMEDVLLRHPATAGVAEVPLDWAEAYYESRFGGETLAEGRLAELNRQLDQLRTALAGRGKRTGEPA